MNYINPKSLILATSLTLTFTPFLSASTTEVKETNQQTTPSIHSASELKFFQLEEIRFNQLSFEQAIEKTHHQYLQICKETDEQPLKLKFNFPNMDKLEKNTAFNFAITSNFDHTLKQLSLVYGMKMQSHKNEYSFTSYEIDQSIETSTIPVPPDFNESWMDIAKTIANGKLTTMHHNKATSTLIVKGEKTSITKLKDFVESIKSIRPLQITIKQRMINYPDDFKLPMLNKSETEQPLTYKEGQNQLIMRKLEQAKGSTIVTLPSIVSRINESSTVEITREHPPTNWTGTKLTQSISLKGLKILSLQHIDLRYFKGAKLQNMLPNNNNLVPKEEQDIITSKQKISTQMRQGQTQFINTEEGNSLLKLISIEHQIIDSTGKPAYPNN